MSIEEMKVLVTFILDSVESGMQPSIVLSKVVKFLVAIICNQE